MPQNLDHLYPNFGQLSQEEAGKGSIQLASEHLKGTSLIPAGDKPNIRPMNLVDTLMNKLVGQSGPAFTYPNGTIVYDPHKLYPDQSGNDQILAHELLHRQQLGHPANWPRMLWDTLTKDYEERPYEKQAVHAADNVLGLRDINIPK